MRKSVLFLFCLLLTLCSFQASQRSSLQPPQPSSKSIHVETLYVLEFDEENKSLICGDGMSPMYWEFICPEKQWRLLKEKARIEQKILIQYFGFDLSDVRSLSSSEDFNKGVILSASCWVEVKIF